MGLCGQGSTRIPAGVQLPIQCNQVGLRAQLGEVTPLSQAEELGTAEMDFSPPTWLVPVFLP